MCPEAPWEAMQGVEAVDSWVVRWVVVVVVRVAGRRRHAHEAREVAVGVRVHVGAHARGRHGISGSQDATPASPSTTSCSRPRPQVALHLGGVKGHAHYISLGRTLQILSADMP